MTLLSGRQRYRFDFLSFPTVNEEALSVLPLLVTEQMTQIRIKTEVWKKTKN